MTDPIEKAAEDALEEFINSNVNFTITTRTIFEHAFSRGDAHGFRRAMESAEVKELVEALEATECKCKKTRKHSRFGFGGTIERYGPKVVIGNLCFRCKALAAFKAKGGGNG